jgi:hypothetical protein
MRHKAWAKLLVVGASWLTACATAPPPPPLAVTAAPEALESLAGEWRGEYWSAATGRRGTIRFTLEADTGAAWGDVWMLPAVHSMAAGEGGAVRGGGAQPLQIRFVRVAAGGALSGTIEPYRDPGCDCLLSSTFTGDVVGDRIDGTFPTSGGPTHPIATGKWEARRVAAGGAE